jgi:GT2 family glycosyltransferase/glycosyltransferase involved in cell wall biosynthesis
LRARPPSVPTVDVIVPIYCGFAETANCLYTALESRLQSPVAYEIVAVDDCSPDSDLSALLVRLAKGGLVTLLRNENNLGFVASVNRGMALHDARDVILLNSDTETYGNWVERLQQAANSARDIGTATPFTNNGDFCSYPYFDKDFWGAFEVPFAEIDQIASAVNAKTVVDIPAARGFCMYIRRDCLKECGFFDEEAFGKGYGEETDFSRRIMLRGWRNVLASDVFVRHHGFVSFGTSAHKLGRQAAETLHQRHPSYLSDQAQFLETDPLQGFRRNIDMGRLRRATCAKSMLRILPHLRGGTEKSVATISRLLEKENVGSFLLRPWPGDGRFGELSYPSVSDLSVLNKVDMTHDPAATAELLREFGIFHIHVHNFIGFRPEILQFIEAVARNAGFAYDVTAHDYVYACPRSTMVDGSGLYCGNDDVVVCQACVNSNDSLFGRVDMRRWRTDCESFLSRARKVFVPDEDVGTRLQSFFPAIQFAARPHPEPVPKILSAPKPYRAGETLRVAVIGALAAHKGSRQVLQCAEDAERRRLPIKFVLYGFDANIKLPRLTSLETTNAGRYAEEDLPALLAASGCQVAFFSSVCPETYSYTLSQAVFAGLYPVAFDIGAIARRIREAGWGLVLPFSLVREPAKINDALLACQIPPLPQPWRPVLGETRYRTMMGDYYELATA